MSRRCVKESADVPLALTRCHCLATSSGEQLRRGPCLCRAHRHPSLLPHTAPRDPVFPCRRCLHQSFHLLRAFGLFTPFPGTKTSWHPYLLLLLGHGAAAGAAPSPRPWGAHALSSNHTKGDVPGATVHPLAKHGVGVSPAMLAQLRSLQGGWPELGSLIPHWGPSFLTGVPAAAQVVPGPAVLGSAGQAPTSDG